MRLPAPAQARAGQLRHALLWLVWSLPGGRGCRVPGPAGAARSPEEQQEPGAPPRPRHLRPWGRTSPPLPPPVKRRCWSNSPTLMASRRRGRCTSRWQWIRGPRWCPAMHPAWSTSPAAQPPRRAAPRTRGPGFGAWTQPGHEDWKVPRSCLPAPSPLPPAGTCCCRAAPCRCPPPGRAARCKRLRHACPARPPAVAATAPAPKAAAGLLPPPPPRARRAAVDGQPHPAAEI